VNDADDDSRAAIFVDALSSNDSIKFRVKRAGATVARASFDPECFIESHGVV
jgi:hypothetical protein